jgi:hypothetical protein
MRYLFCAALSTLCIAQGGSAATVVTSGSASYRFAPPIRQFDPTLGRLLAISVRQYFNISQSVEVIDSDATEFEVRIFGSVGTVFGGVILDERKKQSEAFPIFLASASSSKTLFTRLTASVMSLSEFIGSGTYDSLYGGISFLNVIPLNGTYVNQLPPRRTFEPESVSYQITYEYVELGAVPEPMTWALFISGFFISGTVIRGRKKLSPSIG